MIKFVYSIPLTFKCVCGDSISYNSSHNNTLQRDHSSLAAFLSLVAAGDERKEKVFIIKSKLCVLSFFIQFSRHAQHVVHYLHHHHRTLRQIFILAIFSNFFLLSLSRFIVTHYYECDT